MIPMRPAIRHIYRLLACEPRGTAFIEFAMILPLLLCLLLGSVIGTGMMLAYMKVNDAAQVAADLITQCKSGVSGPTGALTAGATGGDLQNFANAALAEIYPLNTGNMNIAFASVTWNSSGTITGPSAGPDWTWPTGTTMFNSSSAVAQVKAANLIQPNLAGSVIVVNATYTYSLPYNLTIPGLGGTISPSGVPIGSSVLLTESAFSFPRYVSQIQMMTPPSTNTNTNLFCP